MATKLVNGVSVVLTPEEERAHLDLQKRPPEPEEPTEVEVLCEALKAKVNLTDADLTAARTKLGR